MTTMCWEKSEPAQEFLTIQCSCGFLRILATEVAAYSKLPSRAKVIILKRRLIQRRNNMTRVGIKPRSYDQGRRKNDAFILLATVPNKIPKTL